jgi:tetratricopeptide (TPR) repeat protein
MKKVFISYASKDKWVREWLVPKLEEYGIDVQADYKTFLFGKSSLENIESAIENSHHTFFVITENWLTSEWTELESLILQTESPANRDLKYFILKREDCRIPKRLKPFTYVDLTDDAMVETQINRLLQQIGSIAPSHSHLNPKPQHISLSRLPDTSGLLFGREEELKLLDEAWENPNIHVVSFVAQGGEGKTALTRRWVNNMEKEGFRGAERVYAWSFYSQGTSEDRQVSGDLFLAETLTWFGDAAMANSPASVRQKAQRLATLVRQQKTLLILDGVEPLQYPLGEPQNGRMRDEGVKVLLKELANSNSGLCVVSTRQEIRELKGGLVLQQPLSPMSNPAGADLLAELGVTGLRKEFEATAKEYHGHALALTLLGNLLREYHNGDIRQRDVILPLEDEDEWGSHAKRVLGSYAKLLDGKPELGILRMMSLFDRPADMTVVNELRKGPAIPAITDALLGLSEMEWKRACKHLRDLSLLDRGDQLDYHPLIREHFALELSTGHVEAWKEAHRRLYEYYKALPEKEFPDTADEMEPLYRAMGHGCKVGLYQEVFDDLYWKRINREEEYYSWKKLGAFGSDLAAIAGLFDEKWIIVQNELSEDNQAFLLNEAGLCLRALCRLQVAIEALQISLQTDIQQENWQMAALSASNLSEMYLAIGEIEKAEASGRVAVNYSDQGGDLFGRMVCRASLADALNQAGLVGEAEAIFLETEELQGLHQSDSPRLYSVRGYKYCNLLLGKGLWIEVEDRARYALEISLRNKWLLQPALDILSLGKSKYHQIIANGKSDLSIVKNILDEAVDRLRIASDDNMLPLGLLVRASLLRDMQDYKAAQADLDEVLEIADPEMRLHLTDYHLESARLCLAMGDKYQEAQDHYEKAKTLIAETGYHRRDKELEELRVKLENPEIPES